MSAPIAAVRRWEELGQQLQKILTAYLNSCLALDLPLSRYSPGADELISKIDDKLHGFDNLLVRRLNSARSSLARARNKLKAPITCLPEDIITSIFRMVIDAGDPEPGERSTRDRVNARYRHLHTLLAVCSPWRKMVLSHGTFWSVVPVVPQKSGRYMPTAAQRSLDRSSGCKLELVAELFTTRSDISSFVSSLLHCYGSRFRTITLKSDNGPIITQIINGLLTGPINALGSLTDLSMCYHHGQIGRPSDSFHLFLARELEQVTFHRMLGSLQVLKLCGIQVDLTSASCASLTHLRLHGVQFDSHTKITELLSALSSSSQIRILELISVRAFGGANASNPPDDFPVSLPALQLIYLEDLFQDTLNLTLGCIKPGSHRVTLQLTSSCMGVLRPEGLGIETVGIHGLDLQKFKIDTLMLTSRFGGGANDNIRALLELLPSVTSLHIDGCQLTSSYLNQFIRLAHPEYIFPNLSELRISRSFVSPADLEVLKEVIVSHSIQVLGLGICITQPDSARTYHARLQNANERFDPIRKLLSATATVVWLPDSYSAKPPAPEFENNVW